MSIYIATSRTSCRTHYHTDKNCHHIRNSDVREVSMDILDTMSLELCSACSEDTYRTGGSLSTYQKALKADPEDV